MTIPKTARWLDLIAFLLQHRFPVTREEVFEHVQGYVDKRGEVGGEAARRKFERDKDELRALGIEIETLPIPNAAADEPQVGYRLRPRGFYLPYLEIAGRGTPRASKPYSDLPAVRLSEQEVAILDRATLRLAERTEFPLAAAAASVRRKLAFDLPFDPASLERVLAAPLPEEGRRALGVLQQAVIDHVPVECRYHGSGEGETEEYTLEPLGLLFQWSEWYCVGRERPAGGLRVLRLNRVGEIRRAPGALAFEPPADFDIRDYFVRAPWELGSEPATAVRVRFAFPHARWVVNGELGRAVDPILDDGGAILEFDVKDRDTFLRWLLTFQRQATVLHPPEIGSALAGLRERVARLYLRSHE